MSGPADTRSVSLHPALHIVLALEEQPHARIVARNAEDETRLLVDLDARRALERSVLDALRIGLDALRRERAA